MKKRIVTLLGTITVSALVLSGCGQQKADTTKESADTLESTAAEETQEEETSEESVEENTDDTAVVSTEDTADETAENEETEESEESEAATEAKGLDDAGEYEVVRVGSLKGPTTIGLVNLMKESEEGTCEGSYEFTMATQPDELLAQMVSGDLDIALVPANVASVLYNKTESGVSLVDINTLGVLYCVTGDESVTSMEDLAGKTVITTGQGATPEYALNYLLDKYGITDCSVEFKSEATEIAAVLAEDPTKIAVLPQPFVTAAVAKNDKLKISFGLTEAWESVSEDSQLLTGVTVVRNDFLNEHEAEVSKFLKEHEKSTELTSSALSDTAELVAEYGIIEKKEIAEAAIPGCNIVCIKGEEAKAALSGYLQVLFDAEPKSVGGTLPGDDFYEFTLK